MKEPDFLGLRICAGLVDGALYGCVFVLVGSLVGFPPIEFMQSYTPEQQRSYWTITSWTLAFGFAYSFLLHWRCGGTLGKMLTGIRIVSAVGRRLSWQQAFLRTVIVYFLAASIFVPGPLAAALLGAGSEGASSALLMLAMIGVPVVLFYAEKHNRPLHHRLAGVKVVAR